MFNMGFIHYDTLRVHSSIKTGKPRLVSLGMEERINPEV